MTMVETMAMERLNGKTQDHGNARIRVIVDCAFNAACRAGKILTGVGFVVTIA